MRTHLCPRSRKELEANQCLCGNCNLEFKNKDEARKISILYPGGGYFYTRHPWVGIGDAIVEIVLLIGVIVSLVDLINGVAGSGVGLVIYAILLFIEKVIGGRSCRNCNTFYLCYPEKCNSLVLLYIALLNSLTHCLPYSIEQLLPWPVIHRPLTYRNGIVTLKAHSSPGEYAPLFSNWRGFRPMAEIPRGRHS